MRRHGRTVITAVAVVACCGISSVNAAAAEKTLTLRTKAGVLGHSAKIDGTGTFSLVAATKTVSCSNSALEGLALLANESASDRDELIYQGFKTFGAEAEGKCKSTWAQGNPVEVEFVTQYYEVLFRATGHGSIIGSCEEGCNKLNLRMNFSGGNTCNYEFQSVPFKFAPGTAGKPRVVKAIASSKITPSSVFPETCPKSFVVKAKYSFTVSGEALESEAI